MKSSRCFKGLNPPNLGEDEPRNEVWPRTLVNRAARRRRRVCAMTQTAGRPQEIFIAGEGWPPYQPMFNLSLLRLISRPSLS